MINFQWWTFEQQIEAFYQNGLLSTETKIYKIYDFLARLVVSKSK